MSIEQSLEQSIDATLQHIGLISDRRKTLETRQAAAEEQLIHRLSTAYNAGDIGLAEVVTAYEKLRAVGMVGFAGRWNAVMPISANRARLSYANGVVPNGPDGSWHGEGRPYGDAACPAPGQVVVYVLYAEDWTPVYVGSTAKFRARLKEHSGTKAFTHWRAWPCRDREHAYVREAEMLAEVMPHLNRRNENWRLAGEGVGA